MEPGSSNATAALASVAQSIADGTFKMEEIGEDDSIYHYDQEAMDALNVAKPWKEDVNYFKKVRISAVALLKIALHAHGGAMGRKAGKEVVGGLAASMKGGESQAAAAPAPEPEEGEKRRFEVMGYLQGKIVDDTFVIMDSLQVDAAFSETSVELDQNATNQLLAHEKLSHGDDEILGVEIDRPEMGKYFIPKNPVARPEKCVGWYHTHPGLTLFFSGTDVVNQRNMQMFGDPFIALVFEPVQMMELGRCRLGAFRTFPGGFKGKLHDDKAFEKQAAWTSDPGLYAPIPEVDLRSGDQMYYRLEVSVFKSKLDNSIISKLFKEGWGHALASRSPMDNHTKLVHMQDLASRAEEVDEELQSGRMGRGLMGGMGGGPTPDTAKGGSKLGKLAEDATQAAQIQVKDMMKSVIKDVLFNQRMV